MSTQMSITLVGVWIRGYYGNLIPSMNIGYIYGESGRRNGY